jgi:hypothetical protein
MSAPGVRRFLRAAATILIVAIVAGRTTGQAWTQAAAKAHDARVEIAALLHEFLAKVDSAAMHDRFWADDLVYVSNAGVVRTKADILKGMTPAEPSAAARGRAATPGAPAGGYSAEEITIRQFGYVAVLNFRLVQHAAGKPDTSYRNTGVFVLRGNAWQAVSWQATKVMTPGPGTP